MNCNLCHIRSSLLNSWWNRKLVAEQCESTGLSSIFRTPRQLLSDLVGSVTFYDVFPMVLAPAFLSHQKPPLDLITTVAIFICAKSLQLALAPHNKRTLCTKPNISNYRAKHIDKRIEVNRTKRIKHRPLFRVFLGRRHIRNTWKNLGYFHLFNPNPNLIPNHSQFSFVLFSVTLKCSHRRRPTISDIYALLELITFMPFAVHVGIKLSSVVNANLQLSYPSLVICM